jgi:hypothetical protein
MYVVPPVAEYLHVGEGEDKRRQRRGKAAACLGRQKGTVLWINKLVCILAVPKQYYYWPNSTTTAYPLCTVDRGFLATTATHLTHTSALR